MFSKALHNRWARLGMGILGVLLMAISINLFVVPHNLYTGGLLGFCQLFRSVLTQELGVDPGFDISGVLPVSDHDTGAGPPHRGGHPHQLPPGGHGQRLCRGHCADLRVQQRRI